MPATTGPWSMPILMPSACAEGLAGGDHVETAGDRGPHRLVVRREQARRRHECVADRLDLLQAVLPGDLLEALDQGLEFAEHRLRRVPLGIGREPHDVAEQDGNVVVETRLQLVAALERPDDLAW